MIQINIDAKVEAINVHPTGNSCVFHLKDANNLKTDLRISFYKNQMDFIKKQFYEVDRAMIRKELRESFSQRATELERRLRKEILVELKREMKEAKEDA